MDTQSTTSTRPPPTDRPEHPELAAWRLKGFGLLRIAFGLVWAIDASFKWQPNFITHFTGHLLTSLLLAYQPNEGNSIAVQVDQPVEVDHDPNEHQNDPRSNFNLP